MDDSIGTVQHPISLMIKETSRETIGKTVLSAASSPAATTKRLSKASPIVANSPKQLSGQDSDQTKETTTRASNKEPTSPSPSPSLSHPPVQEGEGEEGEQPLSSAPPNRNWRIQRTPDVVEEFHPSPLSSQQQKKKHAMTSQRIASSSIRVSQIIDRLNMQQQQPSKRQLQDDDSDAAVTGKPSSESALSVADTIDTAVDDGTRTNTRNDQAGPLSKNGEKGTDDEGKVRNEQEPDETSTSESMSRPLDPPSTPTSLQGFSRRGWRPKEPASSTSTPTTTTTTTTKAVVSPTMFKAAATTRPSPVTKASHGVYSEELADLNAVPSPRLAGFTRRCWKPKGDDDRASQKLPITATLQALELSSHHSRQDDEEANEQDDGADVVGFADDDDTDKQSVASEIQSHGDEAETEVFFNGDAGDAAAAAAAADNDEDDDVDVSNHHDDGPVVAPEPEPETLKPPVIRSNKLIMLITLYCGNREIMPKQKRAMSILADCGICPVILDGSDPKNRTRRNELFALSGLRAVYPQFFVEEYVDGVPSGLTTFLGTFETVERLKESNELKRAVEV
jgi:hypothetical protein